MELNVDSVLGAFNVAFFLFSHLVVLQYGSRMNSAAVINSLVEIDGRLNAHQRRVDVG